jgi:hypothetical protein
MRKSHVSLTVLSLLAIGAATAVAQGVPSTQPQFLHIFRERLKPGQAADHAMWERGWPAAEGKAKSPFNYIALASVTGPPQVWYVMPMASQAAYHDMVTEGDNNPTLAAEGNWLARGASEFLEGSDQIQAVAVPDLSYGNFPDIGKMRYWAITTFHVKPGYWDEWVAATKAYAAAVARSAPDASWRTYSVVAGAPADTFLVFSSFASFAGFDKAAADSEAIWGGVTEEEGATLQKFFREALASAVTNRFRLDPAQSYVNAETRATDPEFWEPN